MIKWEQIPEGTQGCGPVTLTGRRFQVRLWTSKYKFPSWSGVSRCGELGTVMWPVQLEKRSKGMRIRKALGPLGHGAIYSG